MHWADPIRFSGSDGTVRMAALSVAVPAGPVRALTTMGR
jgi:hypothetical protein